MNGSIAGHGFFKLPRSLVMIIKLLSSANTWNGSPNFAMA